MDAVEAVVANVAAPRRRKLVFHAMGGGPASVQSAAPTTKERFWPIATNRAITNRVRTWSWRSLRAPATSLRSPR